MVQHPTLSKHTKHVQPSISGWVTVSKASGPLTLNLWCLWTISSMTYFNEITIQSKTPLRLNHTLSSQPYRNIVTVQLDLWHGNFDSHHMFKTESNFLMTQQFMSLPNNDGPSDTFFFGGRAVLGMNCLRSLKRRDREFESHSRHGCLCAFLFCLCCSVCR
jgi:hypothetical protein